MKISDSNLNAVTTSAQQAAQAAAAGAGARTASGRPEGARPDRVQLSGLSNALQSLSAGGPERQGQLERLAAAYQSGNYKVNAQAVGKSIITDAMSGS